MAVTNKYPPVKYSFIKGIDETTNRDDAKSIQGTLSVALNADLVDEALLKKRDGYAVVTETAWSTRNVREGYTGTLSTGGYRTLLYGENSTITGTSGILGYLADDLSVTTIASDLKDGVKPSILQFNNLWFIFNGANDFVYDGTTTRQIGIDAPSAAPSSNTTITGDLNTSGSYSFVYTYYNSTTGAESSPSEASDTITTGDSASTTGIRINISAGNSALADKILVYRTVSGGSIFFYDGETTISSTSYDSTVSDAGLGDELELDNSRPIGYAKYAVISGNRIFLAGFSDNPNRVYYSKIGLRGAMPESFQAADFCDCNPSDGDEIIGLGKIGDDVFVLKNNSAGKLISIQAESVGLERQGSSKFLYNGYLKNITGVSHHTIVSMDTYCLWLGTDDIYATDGVNVRRLGKRIKTTLSSLNFAQSWKFSVLNIVETKQLVWSVVRDGATEPDFQLIGHYRYFEEPSVGLAFTFYSPYVNDTATYPGVQAGCLLLAYENNSLVYYFGTSGADGHIYKFNSGNSDDGSGIYFIAKLPWESRDFSASKKMFHSYFMSATAATGATYALNHTFEKDLNEFSVNSSSSSFTGTGATWGNGTWGNFNWSSIRFAPIIFTPHQRGYWGRYGFYNFNANQPVAVQGLIALIGIDSPHN